MVVTMGLFLVYTASSPEGAALCYFKAPAKFAEGVTGLSVCWVKLHPFKESVEN